MKWCPDDSLGWGQKVAGCLCGRDILAECHLLDLLFLCLAGPSSRCRSTYLGEGRGTWLDELAGTVDGSEVWHENQLRLVGYLPLFTGFGIQPNGGYPLGFLNHQNIVVSPQLLIHKMVHPFFPAGTVRWSYFVLHKPMSLQQWSLCSSPSTWSRAALHSVRRADCLLVGGTQDLRRLGRGLRLCLSAEKMVERVDPTNEISCREDSNRNN